MTTGQRLIGRDDELRSLLGRLDGVSSDGRAIWLVGEPGIGKSAATQRPLRDIALREGSGPPAWPLLPSWFVFGDADRNIPVAVHRLMAERAGAKATVELAGASHALTVSRPGEVTEVITAAITAVS
ncbi:ATP-binding protein [Amycolatopsis sp. NPDC051758]|uniref:ATP-binding protein n=1 Tax=Amycolatopsis sp. NPDC051758 TaxID=3363935 RepID=UPI00378DB761